MDHQAFLSLLAVIAVLAALMGAVQDATSYRISDRLNTVLFLSGIGMALVAGAQDRLAAFLWFYPVLLFLWWGRSLPPHLVSEKKGVADEDGGPPFGFRDAAALLIVASPVSWAALWAAGAFGVSASLAWSALSMALFAGIIAAWRDKPSWMGGGDMKMLGGCLSIVGISGLSDFVLYVSLWCLMLAAATVVFRRLRGVQGWHGRRFPAGVPIALGLITALGESAALDLWGG